MDNDATFAGGRWDNVSSNGGCFLLQRHMIRADVECEQTAGIGQSLAAWQQVVNGLGQHRSAIDPTQFENFEKVRMDAAARTSAWCCSHFLQATYAARILYVITTTLAKLAVLYLLYSFSRTKLRRSTVKGVFAFTVLWAVLSVVVLLFQCSPPATWDTEGGKCINLVCSKYSFDLRY